MSEHDIQQEGINHRQDRWSGFIQGDNKLSHFYVCDRQGKKGSISSKGAQDVYLLHMNYLIKKKNYVFGICLNVWKRTRMWAINFQQAANTSLMTKGLCGKAFSRDAHFWSSMPWRTLKEWQRKYWKSSAWTNISFHELCQCFHALDGIFSKQMITGKTQQTHFVW